MPEPDDSADPLEPRGDVAQMRKRLSKALEGDDPLASAGPALAWLEAATLEDFQNLAADPEKFPFPAFREFQNDFRSAFFNTLVDRWLRLDPDGAWEAMKRVQDLWTKQLGPTNDLYSAAACVRPEWVLERTPVTSDNGHLERYAGTALMRLAARDASAARRFLSRLPDPTMRRNAEVTIARGIAQSDPLTAVAIARQMKEDSLYDTALSAAEKIGPGMVRQVVLAAGGKLDGSYQIPWLLLRDPDLAADLAGTGGYRFAGFTQDLSRHAERISPEERARVLAGYATLPDGMRDDIATVLVSSWARTEPRQAAEWALAHAQPQERASPANRAATQAFLRWANTDADAALAWWRALPPSPLRDALGTEASTFIAEAGQLDAAIELFRPSSKKVDEDITAHLAQYIAARDPAEAAAWLASLPADVLTEKAVRHVVRKWYAEESEAVARYVEQLPAGPRRDQALTSFIGEAARQSPSGASEWVETITEPKLRQQAALAVYQHWWGTDAAAAQAWMRALQGVDREWHERFLRRMR